MDSKYLLLILGLCLLLAYQASCHSHKRHKHHHHDHEHADHDHNHGIVLSQSQIWTYGILSGIAVSAIGFVTAIVIVCFKNVSSEGSFQYVIKFLFSLAFGALIGDAFFHILPDVIYNQQSNLIVVAVIFFGSIAFFILLQKVFALFGVTHQHFHQGECPDHQHKLNQSHKDSGQDLKKSDKSAHNQNVKANSSSSQQKNGQSVEKIEIKQNDKKDSLLQNKQKQSFFHGLKDKQNAGYMNLVGSLIHNFMDGLALGAAFAAGRPQQFVPVLVAIIAHQIPRQMGDVAILMTSKFNGVQTILCNGIINLISIVGVVLGLTITNFSDLTKQYILVFVAGNFIFIAADIWKNLFKKSNVYTNLIEVAGLGTGIGLNLFQGAFQEI